MFRGGRKLDHAINIKKTLNKHNQCVIKQLGQTILVNMNKILKNDNYNRQTWQGMIKREYNKYACIQRKLLIRSDGKSVYGTQLKQNTERRKKECKNYKSSSIPTILELENINESVAFSEKYFPYKQKLFLNCLYVIR